MRTRIGNRPGEVRPRIVGVSLGLDAPLVTFINPNSGRIGGNTAVSISGRNFRVGTVPTVTINGIPATSVVVVNATLLTAVTGVATASGLGDVVVTFEGHSGTLRAAFTYYTSVVTGVTPPFGPLNGATLIMISGFNFIEGCVILFGGEEATDIQFIDEQHYSCTTPSHAIGFVDVEMIEPT